MVGTYVDEDGRGKGEKDEGFGYGDESNKGMMDDAEYKKGEKTNDTQVNAVEGGR